MDKIMQAANEIRHFAAMLHASHTLEGKWCDEEGKAEHDRLIALAADLEAARQPERGEAVAWLRKNGFRFNGDIEPQDDSELPLYTHPDSGRVAELEARLAASREREGRMRELAMGARRAFAFFSERDGSSTAKVLYAEYDMALSALAAEKGE